MSLIHELRQQNIAQEAKPETVGYQPLFMQVIKRNGTVLVSENTLDIERMDCIRKTGGSFEKWLHQNKLNMVNSNVKDHWKIYL